MNEVRKPLSRKSDIIVQELPDELLIYDLSNDKAFCLNATSAFVWNASDGSKSVSEIKELMETKFNSKIDVDLIWLALDQLGKDQLLEEKLENKFDGISRREVVRRIGISALIALPVIAALKTNVQAVGDCPSGTVSQNDCATNPNCDNRACTGGSCGMSPNCTCQVSNCAP